jgi:hypothetical protein
MATDDREQQFERALAKHFRDAEENACPDPEVLSAYHERTLSAEEIAKWKEHIAGCARCQETLALVEQTESVDSPLWQERNAALVIEGAAAEPKMARAAAAAMPSGSGAVPVVAAAAPAGFAKRPSRAQWKWIVPIGAIAAGVIVWVGTTEIQKQHEQEAQQAVETAQNRQPAAAPSPMELKTAPSQSSDQKPGEQGASAESRDEREALKAVAPAPSEPSSSPQKIAPGAVPETRQQLDKKKDAIGEGHGYGKGPVPSAPSPALSEEAPRSRSDAQAPGTENQLSAGVPGDARVARANPAPAPAAEKSRGWMANKSAPAMSSGDVSTITGTVLDSSGAAIGGALITAIDTTNGSSKTAVADAAGNFVLPDLPADQYRVVVAHTGFAQAEQTLTLAPQHNEQLKVQLKVGAVAEKVEVNGAAGALSAPGAGLQTADTAASSTELRTLPANGRNYPPLAQLAASDPRYIVAPDQKRAWRVGDGGKIERTTDRGNTWKPQSSGVLADLRAGSATSGRVCWIIGKAGTILLTTDGGNRWKQVTSPIADDIGGIRATDAERASVWDLSNRIHFETSDGGATWTRAANK